MTSKKRQKINFITLCVALSLSLASYLTLRVLESHRSMELQEIMADETETGHALPDVQLLKQLMHKTLEFMLSTPRLQR